MINTESKKSHVLVRPLSEPWLELLQISTDFKNSNAAGKRVKKQSPSQAT